MKTFTKNSHARLLTLSLIAVSSCNIQADFTSNINGGDASKTLLSLHGDITTLGTVPLATAATVGTPLIGGTDSTVSLVLGDPTVSTGAASISAALGTPITTIAGDIANTKTAVTTLGTAALATAAIVGNPAHSTIAGDIAAIATALTDGIVVSPTGLATSGNVADIEGGATGSGMTPFVAYSNDSAAGDSLHNISNNNITVPFATSAQAAAIQGSSFTTGDDLHSIKTAVNTTATAANLATLQSSVNTMAASTNLAAVQSALATDITNATNSSSYLGTKVGSPAHTSISGDIANVVTILGTPTTSVLADIAGDIIAATNNSSTIYTAISNLGAASGDVSNLHTALGTLATSANLTTLQTTANTINTNSSAIQGGAATATNITPFKAYTTDLVAGDSLHNISNNNISVPFATSAQATAIQGSGFSSANSLVNLATHTDVTTLGTSALATATNLATLQTTATAIQGSGFTAGTDDLHSVSTAVNTMAASTTLAAVQSAVATDITNATNSSSIIYTAISNLGAASGDVSNLHSLISAIPTSFTGLALTTDVTGIQGTNTAATLTAIEGASFGAGDDLHSIKAAVAAIPGDITSATSPLATSANLATLQTTANTINTNSSAIQGGATASTNITPFKAYTTDLVAGDSLHNISNNNISVPFATSAQATAIQGSGFSSANSLVNLATHTDVTTLGTSALATAAIIGSPAHTTIAGDIASIATTLADGVSVSTTGLASTADVSAIQGGATGSGMTPFVAYTDDSHAGDSLHNISNNNISVPFATAAIIGSPAHSTIAGDIASIATTLAGGVSVSTTGLATAAALLQVISQLQSNPIAQVINAKNNAALTTPVTSADAVTAAVNDLAAYNASSSSSGSLAYALAAVTTATTAGTICNASTAAAITAVNAAIDTFYTLTVQWNTDGLGANGYASSAYSAPEISWALQQLSYALAYLLSQQPTA